METIYTNKPNIDNMAVIYITELGKVFHLKSYIANIKNPTTINSQRAKNIIWIPSKP